MMKDRSRHVHHLNESKLGNATVLTATSATAASKTQPWYSDELTVLSHITQKL